MAQISSTKCNLCENGLGKLFCHECKQFLCDSCNTTHVKIAATKHHFVTDANNIDLSLHLVCDEHKLGFAHYCITCESLTCSFCVTTNHNGHSFTTVTEIASKAREEVRKYLVNLKEKHLKLSNLIDKTKSKDIDFIKKVSDKYVNDVNQVSDDLIQIVNFVKEKKTNRASDYYVIEKQELGDSVAKLEKINNEYKQICNQLEQLLHQKHDVAFWVKHKSIVKELSELENIPNIEEPSPIETFDINDYFDLVLENIQNKFQIGQFKGKTEEIRKLTEKLEEAERNMGQKDIQIATLTRDNIAELAKLNDNLEQEKAQCIKLRQDHERQFNVKTEENRKLTEKLEEAERKIGQKDVQIAILTRDNVAELAKLNDTLKQEKAQFIKFKQDHESALKEKDEEIQKLKATMEKAEQYKLSCQAKMKQQIERTKQLEKDKEQLEKDVAIMEKGNIDKNVKIRTEIESYTAPSGDKNDVNADANENKLSVNSVKSEKDKNVVDKIRIVTRQVLENPAKTAYLEMIKIFVDNYEQVKVIILKPTQDDDFIQVKGRYVLLLKKYPNFKLKLENFSDAVGQQIPSEGSSVDPENSEMSSKQKQRDEFKTTQLQKTPKKKFEEIVTFKMTELEFKMLKHFYPESKIFGGKHDFKDGALIKAIEIQEKVSDLESEFYKQINFIRSMSTMNISYHPGISEEKMYTISRNVSEADQIFYQLSTDQTMLTLYGPSYQNLGEEKHKIEITLGLKEQRKGRRDRVYADSDTKSSSSTGINTKETSSLRSSGNFSMSVSASYSTVLDQTFKTTEGLIVKVYVGNILRLDVDCIVNAANETLSHGEGVAHVIAEAAGYDFEKESDEYVRQNGKIPVGTCCTTSAGRLKYKCVIHTVGPKWHMYSDKKHCCFNLRKAVESCFFEAEVKNMTSIALPSISAGIFGVPIEVCCSEYCNAVEDFSRNNGYKTCLKEIHFIDKDASLITKIQNEFSQRLNRSLSLPSNFEFTNQSNMSASVKDNRITRSYSVPEDPNTVKEKPLIPSALSSSINKNHKQFIVNNDLKVTVVQDDLTTMKVSTIVCPQDEYCSNKGAIAQAIAKISDEKYRREILGLPRTFVGDIRKVKASPPSLPFQYVLQTVPPRFDKIAEANPYSFEKDLEITIKNILRHCIDNKNVTSVALPVLGIGQIGFQTSVTTFAKLFLKVLGTELKSENKFAVKEIYIVTNYVAAASTIADEFAKEKLFEQVTSFHRSRNKGEKGNSKQDSDDTKPSAIGQSFRESIPKDETCVICMETLTKPRQLKCGHIFCTHCIEGQFKVKPVCPTCGSSQGVVTGDQPPGKMNRHDAKYSLPGYSDVGTIEISYEIYDGYQGKEHPNPEKFYKGIKRTAYLPNTKKGRLVADLLKVAFDRKLVFTIGHSRTTGEQGVVTWNDIHHKTSNQRGHQFGYPDDTYLDRVLDELKVKGVTEADVVKK